MTGRIFGLLGLVFHPCPKGHRPFGAAAQKTGFRHEKTDFRPERADSRPERADSRPERADFRPEKADFRSNRSPKGNIWSAIPIAPLCVIVKWCKRKQGSEPKGTKSCRTQGDFCSSVRPFVSPPQALSGLESALSGLKYAL